MAYLNSFEYDSEEDAWEYKGNYAYLWELAESDASEIIDDEEEAE